jgi:hypothetical protein
MPLSVSPGVLVMSRARARAGPTTGLVGWWRLVEVDGGAWGLLARGLVLASLLCLSPTGGVLVMSAREGEGKVRCSLRVPAG